MTYAVYDLTEHTQLSIRGTTGSHPDSKFVFGIFMDNDCLEDDPTASSFDSATAYDDMDWDKAVEMAIWILEENKWIQEALNKTEQEAKE